MSKAIMLSIRPEWCEKIASGRKTIEVRKTRPKLTTPFKAIIYMTKGTATYWTSGHVKCVNDGGMNVIGEFVCDRVETLARVGFSGSGEEPKYCVYNPFDARTKPIDGILDDGCLSLPELETYLAGAVGYAWHISDLVIYDNPKELSEFYRACPGLNESGMCWECDKAIGEEHDCGVNGEIHLIRPPQSWRYVEELT